MIHAYDEMYIDGAMNRMGDMIEYASLDVCVDADAFFKMFLDSGYDRKFEIGDVSVLAGKSGPEIAMDVLAEVDNQTVLVEPMWREERSEYFWAGWLLAYFQWYENIPYRRIWRHASLGYLLKMYPTYHEADIFRAVEHLEKLVKKTTHRDIVQLRISRGWSQAQLAKMAGMSVSQLQRLEYGERKTDNLTLKTAISLADALGIEVEELMSE